MLVQEAVYQLSLRLSSKINLAFLTENIDVKNTVFMRPFDLRQAEVNDGKLSLIGWISGNKSNSTRMTGPG